MPEKTTQKEHGIAGDYYVRSAVLSREERIVFLRNNSRKREKMGRLDCDVRVGKL